MLRVTGGDAALARRYARRSFGNYAVYLVDFLRLVRVTPAEVARRVDFDDWGLIEGHRDGNGILFVTMHFGNWDLGAAALATHGIPVTTIADTFSDRRLNELVIGSREHLGMKVISAQRMGPGVLRALRGNDVVATLIDVPQPSDSGGVEVEFFGETVSVPDGPARIALRAGSQVVAATLPRSAPHSDHVTPDLSHVPFEPTGDQERDVKALTQATLSTLERLIRRDPSQWYIFRSLWVADAVQR
jgi:KDO2-lipid IV(A) lauroyltransferase